MPEFSNLDTTGSGDGVWEGSGEGDTTGLGDGSQTVGNGDTTGDIPVPTPIDIGNEIDTTSNRYSGDAGATNNSCLSNECFLKQKKVKNECCPRIREYYESFEDLLKKRKAKN